MSASRRRSRSSCGGAGVGRRVAAAAAGAERRGVAAGLGVFADRFGAAALAGRRRAAVRAVGFRAAFRLFALTDLVDRVFDRAARRDARVAPRARLAPRRGAGRERRERRAGFGRAMLSPPPVDFSALSTG
jgi:hypothetical protein